MKTVVYFFVMFLSCQDIKSVKQEYTLLLRERDRVRERNHMLKNKNLSTVIFLSLKFFICFF